MIYTLYRIGNEITFRYSVSSLPIHVDAASYIDKQQLQELLLDWPGESEGEFRVETLAREFSILLINLWKVFLLVGLLLSGESSSSSPSPFRLTSEQLESLVRNILLTTNRFHDFLSGVIVDLASSLSFFPILSLCRAVNSAHSAMSSYNSSFGWISAASATRRSLLGDW